MIKKLLAVLLAVFLSVSITACDDAPGEDEIGDGEINDEE
jgi:uncharacterized lipoprotein YehR (DUF1307 family)